jgi:hypothetical protein
MKTEILFLIAAIVLLALAPGCGLRPVHTFREECERVYPLGGSVYSNRHVPIEESFRQQMIEECMLRRARANNAHAAPVITLLLGAGSGALAEQNWRNQTRQDLRAIQNR